MSRAFRKSISHYVFYNDEIPTRFEMDNIPGTLVRKVSYNSLQEFLTEFGVVSVESFEKLSLKDKRVLAVFLRKLQDRYSMFNIYLKNNKVSEEVRNSNEEYLLKGFIEEAYARRAMNRLFFYCWYKSRECFKDYENYSNHPK